MSQDIITTTGSGTWTAPGSGTYDAIVEIWAGGGGGDGQGGGLGTSGLKGGGGGAYSKKTLSVTGGVGYNYFVGAGGSGVSGSETDGEDSWFVDSSTVLAKKGLSGSNGGSGGQDSNGIGDVKFSGGQCGDPDLSGNGGGGGGGAGTANNGGAGSSPGGGTGGASDGGNGGAGGAPSNPGSNGSVRSGGGGGAGSGSSINGGNGARGELRITYNVPQVATAGVGTVTITGHSPSASGSGTGKATPDVGTVTISGTSPSIGGGTAIVTPGVATVGVTGISPSAFAFGTVTVVPGVGTVSITTPAGTPAVARHRYEIGGEGAYRFHSVFTAGNVGGEYRIANDIAGYTARVGVGVLPDMNAPPDVFSKTLPFSVPITPPGSGTENFFVNIKKRDSYGIESVDQFSEVFTIDDAGNEVRPEVPAPKDLRAKPLPNSIIRIQASYPDLLVDRYPADQWRIVISDNPSAGPVTMFNVPLFAVKGVQMSKDVGPAMGFTAVPGMIYDIDVSLHRVVDNADGPSITIQFTYPPIPGEPKGVYSGWDFPNN